MLTTKSVGHNTHLRDRSRIRSLWPFPVQERIVTSDDSIVFLGIRASCAVAYRKAQRSGPNVVAALTLETSRSSFLPTRALSLGYSEHAAWGTALVYGYQLGGKYEIGGFLVTDRGGSGVFLRIGAEGEIRSSGRSPFGEFWGYPALGYLLQHKHGRVELAILPSLGGMSVVPTALDLAEPFWLRQRLRARLWHVLIELEHGRHSRKHYTAGYWQGSVCSSAGTIPFIACTSAVFFDRAALPRAPRSEVSIPFGFGGLYQKTAAR